MNDNVPLTPDEIGELSALLDQALELPREARETWLANLDTQHQHLRPLLKEMWIRTATSEDSSVKHWLTDIFRSVEIAPPSVMQHATQSRRPAAHRHAHPGALRAARPELLGRHARPRLSQNIAALLQRMPGPPPFDLLDFGCGPGRDLHTFKALGHRAVGLEGAPSAAALARAHSGCEVLEQSFLQLELPSQRYDGVFANAVPCNLSGAAAGVATTAGLPAAWWRAVQFQPARRWPGGLER